MQLAKLWWCKKHLKCSKRFSWKCLPLKILHKSKNLIIKDIKYLNYCNFVFLFLILKLEKKNMATPFRQSKLHRICRWHHDHWLHFRWRQVWLQSRDESPDIMVLGQQPAAQHQQGQRAHCRLQQTAGWRAHPHSHWQDRVGENQMLQVSGVNISEDLSWSHYMDLITKAAKQLCFLRWLKRFGIGSRILTNFYWCTIKRFLSGYITTWYGTCNALDHKALWRVVRSAHRSAVFLFYVQYWETSETKNFKGFCLLNHIYHIESNVCVLKASNAHLLL